MIHLLDELQPALRVGFLDPDLDRDLDPAAAKGKDELWHFDAGVNWLFRQHEAKLQLNFTHSAYQDRTANNQVILAAQAAY